MSTSVPQIERLAASNYDSWSVQMRSVLIFQNLWGYVDGTKVKPEATSAEYADWSSSDGRALALILMSVKPTQLSYIKKSETSAMAWQKLKGVYAASRPAQKYTVVKKLLRSRYEEDMDMETYLKDHAEIIEQLTELNINIPEAISNIILLESLPASYDNFTMSMQTRDDLPCFEILRSKLLDEDIRRTEKNTPESAESKAFATKSTKHHKKNKNKGCFECGSKDHFKSECDKRRKMEQYDRKKKINPSYRSGNSAFSALLCNKSVVKGWYIDSGASNHMTNTDKHLRNAREVHVDNIVSASDAKMQVKNIGDTTIKINSETIDIHDVMHVPGLVANLLSVSKIVERGNSVLFDNSGCTIKNSFGKRWFIVSSKTAYTR